MKRCKKTYIFCAFFVLSVCIQGCGKDKETEKMELSNLVANYERAMKVGDYEQADSYWIDADENKYAHLFDEVEADSFTYVCENYYLESLEFETSEIQISGNEASGSINIYLSNVYDMMDYLLNCVNSGKLQMDSSEEQIQEKLEEHDFVTKWEGTIHFEKQDGKWKIKSITED